MEASKAAVKVEGHQKAVTTLLVANSYEQDDLVGEWRPMRFVAEKGFNYIGWCAMP